MKRLIEVLDLEAENEKLKQENKFLRYENKKLENELKFAREMAIRKHKKIKQLQEEIQILHCNLRG